MEQTSANKTRAITSWALIFSYWMPVVVWMSIIFFFSSRHSVSVSDEYFWNFLFFKSLHIIEYATLFILLVRALRQTGGVSRQAVFVRAYIITIVYAITDELHQWFVPSRTPQPRDVIIDAIGAGLVWYYLSTQLPKAQEKLKRWARMLGVL